ncbi:MAG TPA: cytochrome c biogenesis protein CcsA, partial [Phycisphaerae bacterium]
ERLGKLAPEVVEPLQRAWSGLVKGWQTENAAQVNTAVASLADLLPNIESRLYPNTKTLFWESWYFRYHGLTWVWTFYLLSVVLLLLSVVYRFPWARKAGMLTFAGSVLAHTAAVGLRFYVSGRWPNSNMFEAVTTSAWFGGIFALIIERFARKTPLRGLFALASAVASMVALMAGHFIPELDPSISNKMAALNDVWIYIHTNVIISSYCLIFMACVSALGYLRYRLGGGSAEVSRSGGAGTLVMNGAGGKFLLDESKTNWGVILDAWTMVLMELSFVMLWTGLVMGAIWADHSWGRPWGWDPKEIFALNTFIIFLLLVHVRIKVKDKGLWTAVLAATGCGVMLFNWIVINFIVSGLHSYA